MADESDNAEEERARVLAAALDAMPRVEGELPPSLVQIDIQGGINVARFKVFDRRGRPFYPSFASIGFGKYPENHKSVGSAHLTTALEPLDAYYFGIEPFDHYLHMTPVLSNKSVWTAHLALVCPLGLLGSMSAIRFTRIERLGTYRQLPATPTIRIREEWVENGQLRQKDWANHVLTREEMAEKVFTFAPPE